MKFLFGFISFFLFTNNELIAQGCSDEGFCTSGAMHSGSAIDNVDNLQVSFTPVIGGAENGTIIFAPQFEMKKSFQKIGMIEIKLPFSLASGNLGTHKGLGDPIVTFSSNLHNTKNISFQYIIGTRISIGNANATGVNNLPLPMTYQSNLGTTDIITGLVFGWKKMLSFSLGWQQPILQYNENNYLNPEITGHSDDHVYFSSRKLNRKGDVLMRMEYQYTHTHWGASAGPLFIYHLDNDRITLNDNSVVELSGSDGLTLNIAGSFYCKILKWKFDCSVGTPLIVRTYRPDGLTRAWVIAPRITYTF
jgi:hypothetical protein